MIRNDQVNISVFADIPAPASPSHWPHWHSAAQPEPGSVTSHGGGPRRRRPDPGCHDHPMIMMINRATVTSLSEPASAESL